MIGRLLQFTILAGGAVLGPLPALGHGCEFLLDGGAYPGTF